MVTVKSSESKLTEKHLKLMSLRIRYYVTGARRRNEVPGGKHLDLTDAGKNSTTRTALTRKRHTSRLGLLGFSAVKPDQT